MKDNSRALTINFMDGTKVSYGFLQQGMNSAAKQLKIDELLKNPFVMVLAENVLTMFPVANIKSIQLSVDPAEVDKIRLPAHTIRDATLTRGDV
ncbi:MAG TPA: hypothetical protein VNC62_13080 [Burkholderiales bacterium]|jgi:hypothetical protein|nr:hypothetical protein [Burkholderiales bacterium]